MEVDNNHKKNSVLCVRLDDYTKEFLTRYASYNGVSVGYMVRKIIKVYRLSRESKK